VPARDGRDSSSGRIPADFWPGGDGAMTPTRRSTARRRQPRAEPKLPSDLVEQLVENYLRDDAAWAAGARISDTKTRLSAVMRGYNTVADAVGDLQRAEWRLVGFDKTTVKQEFERLLAFAAKFGAAVEDLDSRGAAKGGNRRLPQLYGETPPRFKLALAIRDHFRKQGIEPVHRVLRAQTTDILTHAGEEDPERGLDDIIRSLPKSPKHQAKNQEEPSQKQRSSRPRPTRSSRHPPPLPARPRRHPLHDADAPVERHLWIAPKASDHDLTPDEPPASGRFGGRQVKRRLGVQDGEPGRAQGVRLA
jgi:hypothetical protein